LDPVTAGIAAGAAKEAAKELGKVAIRQLQEKQEQKPVCVEKKIPGTTASVKVCVESEQVCGTVPHPRTGLPVQACVITKVTRADAHDIANQIASSLADNPQKQISSSNN
jgi:hypothetical protein